MKLLGSVGKMMGTVRIVSLLQPPPETVALFDEIILVDSGLILYAGPVGEVVEHFESLGYKLPDRTDVADWLLVSDDSALERWAAISNVVCSSGTPHQGRGKVPCKRKFATPYERRIQSEIRCKSQGSEYSSGQRSTLARER
jgi:hypothetical protein